MRRLVLLGCAALFAVAGPAAAQLRSDLYAGGFSLPVAFVQDPTRTDTQYVVEQGGRIRVVRSGQVLSQDWLDLRSVVSRGGEQGLLGLVFAQNYASSGRFFINFTDLNGHTVVARFLRSAAQPDRADAASRFDLKWPDGNRFITQPFANHNGGHLAFGADGYLYIGLGDGGSGNDPDHRAQDPSTLLGKMLRIDVSVSAADAEGYDVPADNPFVGRAGYLREIWAIGLRNPWRYTLDDPGLGGTGAWLIADVGQSQWEEVNYEPRGRGGRNYGWRNREGAHAYLGSPAPATMPLVDPIIEYDHSVGQSITGGFVYRGTQLGPVSQGRYFFADFIAGRVWSAALSIDPATSEASLASVAEHTSELGGASLGNISSFGVDASGELYLLLYGSGTVRRITRIVSGPTDVRLAIDASVSQNAVSQPFHATGWAIDLNSGGGVGVDTVHLWAFPVAGGAPTFVGAGTGVPRSDVAATFGAGFSNSGFDVVVSGLAPGTYVLTAYAHSVASNRFEVALQHTITIGSGAFLIIDTPAVNAHAPGRLLMGGWAIDAASPTGSGIDTVHVWAFPSVGAPRFVGAAPYGLSRPDVGAAVGPRFTNSGWNLIVAGLPSGTWTLVAFSHSTATNAFVLSTGVQVVIDSGLRMSIDLPATPLVTGTGFTVAGWALDYGALTGSGVDAVHVWAYPASGAAPQFVGAAVTGGNRPDLGNIFGGQFAPCGYGLTAQLPPGIYTLVVYVHSTVTGTFGLASSVVIDVR